MHLIRIHRLEVSYFVRLEMRVKCKCYLVTKSEEEIVIKKAADPKISSLL